MRRIWIFLLCGLGFTIHLARAHSGVVLAQERETVLRVERLTGNTYCIFGRGGNIGFVVTPEGVLVVDDQFENVAPAIVEEIKKITDKPIRFLVNTHFHGDHTGGNPVFGRFSLILAHDNVRQRMLHQPEIFLKTLPGRIGSLKGDLEGAAGASARFLDFLQGKKRFLERRVQGARDFNPGAVVPPVLTYQRRLQVYLGEEEVQVSHFRRGHTDGDSVVYFPGQKVLHMGDLFFHGTYPFIDADGGGHAGEWVETLDEIFKMVPGDVKIIPGHGKIATLEDLKYFRNYLADLRAEVGEAVRSGKSLREMINEIRMEKFGRIQPGFMKLEYNIDVVYEELRSGN